MKPDSLVHNASVNGKGLALGSMVYSLFIAENLFLNDIVLISITMVGSTLLAILRFRTKCNIGYLVAG